MTMVLSVPIRHFAKTPTYFRSGCISRLLVIRSHSFLIIGIQRLGFWCQVSGARYIRAETRSLNIHMKLPSFRQDLQDYQDFFRLVYFYPAHPVDPVRKWTVFAVKFFIGLNWPLLRPAAELKPKH